MGFKEWIYGLFEPPCLHQWDKIAELRDKPKNPTAATVVRMCRHCGEVRETTFKAPEGIKTEPVCPPHKWGEAQRMPVYPNGTTNNKAKEVIPGAYVFIMKCERCGDIQQRKVQA